MKAGLLSSKITIEQQTTTQDAAGQIVGAWTVVAAVWADVRQQRGMEVIKADAMVSTVKTSIRIRRRTDINAGMRVLLDGAVYNILAVSQDVGSKVYTDLICEVYV